MTSLAWDLSFPMENVSGQLSLWKSESCYEYHLFSCLYYNVYFSLAHASWSLQQSAWFPLQYVGVWKQKSWCVDKNNPHLKMTYFLKHLGRNPQTWPKIRRTCNFSTDNGGNFERYHVLCDDHEPNVCRQLKLMPYYSVHFLFRWQSIIQLCCLGKQ